jgi:hypothetical protein
MTKQFSFTYNDDSKDRITFEYSPQADEKLHTSVENGIPFLYLNRPGMITLAKMLIKIANGAYSDGFHVHLHQDFNANEPERLAVLLSSD